MQGAILSSFAVLASAGLWMTIAAPDVRALSLSLALMAAAVLMIVARWQRVTSARWWQLVGGGFAGVLGIARALASGYAVWQVFGLLVAFVGLIAIRLALAKDGKP